MNEQPPNSMKGFAADPKIYESIEVVGAKFDLNGDQMGELDAELRRVLLGISQAADFTKNITELLGIEESKAKLVADEINTGILQVLKTKSQTTAPQGPDSSLEQAGSFEIEHDMPASEDDSLKGANTRGFSAFSSGDKADMLSSIENPVPTAARVEQKPAPKGPMTEPLIDQLLAGASAPQTQRKIDHAPLQKPQASTPQPPRNLPTDDPYREVM